MDLGEETGGEWVGRHLRGATMIKAFNAMFASYIREDPRRTVGRRVVFVARDDDGASTAFAEFVDAMGFARVFVGALREDGRLMQLGGPLSALHVIRQD